MQGDQYNNTLQAASVTGHSEVIQLLLDNGTDINALGEKYTNTLQAAIVRGRVDIIELLTDNGTDIYTQGRSTLQAASALGHLEIVELLLHMDVFMNKENREFFNNLLGVVLAGNNPNIAQYLLAKRSSVLR